MFFSLWDTLEDLCMAYAVYLILYHEECPNADDYNNLIYYIFLFEKNV